MGTIFDSVTRSFTAEPSRRVLGDMLPLSDPSWEDVSPSAGAVPSVGRNAALTHAYSSDKLSAGDGPLPLEGGSRGESSPPRHVAALIHRRLLDNGYAHVGQAALSHGPPASRSGQAVYSGTVANYYEKGRHGMAVIHSDDDASEGNRVHGYWYDADKSPIGKRGSALARRPG